MFVLQKFYQHSDSILQQNIYQEWSTQNPYLDFYLNSHHGQFVVLARPIFITTIQVTNDNVFYNKKQHLCFVS